MKMMVSYDWINYYYYDEKCNNALFFVGTANNANTNIDHV